MEEKELYKYILLHEFEYKLFGEEDSGGLEGY